MMLIPGQAGIGKSRLGRHAVAVARPPVALVNRVQLNWVQRQQR